MQPMVNISALVPTEVTTDNSNNKRNAFKGCCCLRVLFNIRDISYFLLAGRY